MEDVRFPCPQGAANDARRSSLTTGSRWVRGSARTRGQERPREASKGFRVPPAGNATFAGGGSERAPGNPCGSPSPVLRRRVQNSITRSRQNQPPRAPKWALGGLRRNRRWEALRPPLRGGKRVSGRTFWELLLQRTLEACETMKHGSKINMFGAL